MFNSLAKAELELLLNLYPVPMFVLDRVNRLQSFHMVLANPAFCELTGKNCRDMVDKPIDGLIPKREAELAKGYYDRCATTNKVVRFSGIFSFGQRPAEWDTTLQSAATTDGHDRIIATTLLSQTLSKPLPDKAAFEDINYLSSIADFQLENLNTMFKIASDSASVAVQSAVRIEKMSGVCRTVQRAVSDIKQVVKEAQARHDLARAKQDGAQNVVDIGMRSKTVQTLGALAKPVDH